MHIYVNRACPNDRKHVIMALDIQEILEYPYNLGGLHLKRISMSLKTTWLRRIAVSDSGWTTFALAQEIEKCWLYGDNYLEKEKNTIKNIFWTEVAQSIYDLRYIIKPTLRLPEIKKLKVRGVNVVADLLDSTCEVLPDETIEQCRNVNLNFLEYMAIKQSLTSFIKNANKNRVNIGPYRPYMLNLAFHRKRDARIYIYIYKKTGQYGDKLLEEISLKWDILDTDTEEIKPSISLFKKKLQEICIYRTSNSKYGMIEWQRDTNCTEMNITEDENCAYCQQIKTNVHAFITCERSQRFWRDIKFYLLRLGYRNFRLEHKVLILGNTEIDNLFNLIIMS